MIPKSPRSLSVGIIVILVFTWPNDVFSPAVKRCSIERYVSNCLKCRFQGEPTSSTVGTMQMNGRETEIFVNETNHRLPSLFDTKRGTRRLSVVTNQSRISKVWEHVRREFLNRNLIKVDFNTCRFICICSKIYKNCVSWFSSNFESEAGGLTLIAPSLA